MKREYQKNNNIPIQADEFGKLPPQAPELEELVLGALMIESDAFGLIADFLKPEHFYKIAHQKIFTAIENLIQTGAPTDFIMVTEKLRELGFIDDVGGAYFITLLTSKLSSSASIENHARIIFQKFLAREAIRIATEIQTLAFDDKSDIADILSYANKSFSDIISFSNGDILTMYDAVEQMRNNIFKNSSDNTEQSGFKTGFKDFDRRGGGFQKSDLIIIAAESSQGKTSLALTIVDNMALNGAKIAIYSLEMKATQLAARFTSYHTGIPANEILYSRFDNERFNKLDRNIKKLLNYDIFIDEKSNSTIESVLNSIRGMKKNYNIDGAVIDYIQLLSTSERGMNKEQQTAYIARSLKNIAKELDIFIIALSQLARDNTNPVPSIKRLRDSGQIEEATDVCFLIYRPEQVGRTNFPDPFNEFSVEKTAMIDIAKGRNIGTFKFLSHFESSTTHFSEFESYDRITNEAKPKSLSDKPF